MDLFSQAPAEPSGDPAATALGAIVIFIAVLAVVVHGKNAKKAGKWLAGFGAALCGIVAGLSRSVRRVWPNQVGRAGVLITAGSIFGPAVIPMLGALTATGVVIGAVCWLTGEYQARQAHQARQARQGTRTKAGHPEPVRTATVAEPVGTAPDVSEIISILESAEVLTATSRYGVANVDPAEIIRALKQRS